MVGGRGGKAELLESSIALRGLPLGHLRGLLPLVLGVPAAAGFVDRDDESLGIADRWKLGSLALEGLLLLARPHTVPVGRRQTFVQALAICRELLDAGATTNEDAQRSGRVRLKIRT